MEALHLGRRVLDAEVEETLGLGEVDVAGDLHAVDTAVLAQPGRGLPARGAPRGAPRHHDAAVVADERRVARRRGLDEVASGLGRQQAGAGAGSTGLPFPMWALIYAASGLVALALEVVWFRLLTVMMKGTAFTTGSVVFAGASGVYSQNNSNLFWDNTNNRLGWPYHSCAYPRLFQTFCLVSGQRKYAHNKLFKRDSARVALLVCVDFSG